MAIKFVRPNTIRLELESGGWIEVHERLSYGAQQRLQTSAVRQMGSVDGGEPKFDVDLGVYQIERMLAFIVEWDARYPDGKPVKITRESFMQLDQDSAAEINAALDAHIEGQANQGNANSGGNAIGSPSLSVAG